MIRYPKKLKKECKIFWPNWNEIHKLLESNNRKVEKKIYALYKKKKAELNSFGLEVEKIRNILLKIQIIMKEGREK